MKRTMITIVIVTLLLTFTGCNSETKEENTISTSTLETTTETTHEITEFVPETETTTEWWWKGETLSKSNPKVEGPTGTETYFNEDVSKLVKIAEKSYIGKYWTREDGVKMFGEYIICKAKYQKTSDHPNLSTGTIIPTTLGVAIVCSNDTDEDICIAVTW